MENLPKLCPSQVLRLPVLDPQLEPKMTASRKDSLGETYVDRHRAALCLLAHEMKSKGPPSLDLPFAWLCFR